MEIIVKQVAQPQGRWKVQMGQFSVPFRTENEARCYAVTLESRLKAPHPWPRREY